MKFTEYKQAQAELNLSEEQKQLLGRCLGYFILQPSEAYKDCELRAQKRKEPLPPIAYRHQGKIEGLKLAMQFVLGTLTMSNGLEPDSPKLDGEASTSPFTAVDPDDLIIVGLLTGRGQDGPEPPESAGAGRIRNAVRAAVGTPMPGEILGEAVVFPPGTEGAPQADGIDESPTTSTLPHHFFLDEWGYYVGRDDAQVERLRSIDGVPPVRYEVADDGRVFVFNKLKELVRERLGNGDLKDPANIAVVQALVDQARVTPTEAVFTWGIVPEPYELVRSGQQGWSIRHKSFHAYIGDHYMHEAHAKADLVRLLEGHVVDTTAHFSDTIRVEAKLIHWHGQCMALPNHPLPARPHLHWPNQAGDATDAPLARLASISFVPGFPAIDETMFHSLALAERSWISERAGIERQLATRATELWAAITPSSYFGSYLHQQLDDDMFNVPEGGEDDLKTLRQAYPELIMLSDGSLYCWYAYYNEACNYLSGVENAGREDSFLFYLMGAAMHAKRVDGHLTMDNFGSQNRERGILAFHASAHGYTHEAAIKQFVAMAEAYDTALTTRVTQVVDTMRFLVDEPGARVIKRGSRVHTLGDFYRDSRVINGSAVEAKKNQDDQGHMPKPDA
jgi:hypothetical protein